jgi:hypothetical protein
MDPPRTSEITTAGSSAAPCLPPGSEPPRLRTQIVITLILIVAGCLLVGALSTKIGDGWTDLVVVFLVTEDNTGTPIPNAVITLELETGDDPVQSEMLTTDTQGAATRVYPRRNFSTHERFFITTWGIHVPEVRFRVSAPGYRTTEWLALDRTKVQRGELVTLPIRVSLQKDAP